MQGEVDTDSIGNVICRKADEVDAAAVVMASHTRSKLTEFVLGSVTNYCTCARARLRTPFCICNPCGQKHWQVRQ